ncbi:MAG: DUF4340 domain-containing protein [bacterium]
MNYKKTVILIIFLCILVGIAYFMNRPAKKAKEPALFPGFDAEKAVAIRINGERGMLTLSKVDGRWIAVEQDNLPADNDQVKQALQTIAEIDRDNVVSRNPDKQGIFEVDPNSGFEVLVQGEGDTPLAHFYIGKNGPDFMSTYVRKAGSDEVILYSGFHLKSRFDKPADTWLDRFVLLVQEPDVDRIEFSTPDGSYSIVQVRDEGKWRMETPEEAEVKEDMIKDMTQTLFNLRATKVQRLKPDQSLKEFNIDPPSVTITVGMADETATTLLISSKNEKTEEFFVKPVDRDVIYTVGAFSVNKLNKKWQQIKDEAPPPPQESVPAPPEENT